MVNVADWSATPALNVTVDGISITEGCPAANLNNASRAIMAGVRSMYNGLPTLTDYVKKDGTVAFTGQPTYSGRGAFLHHASSSLASGKIIVTASGASEPTMSDGDIWLELE